jgi:probable selenium-dependent hydroxylase accessory protein YqeC
LIDGLDLRRAKLVSLIGAGGKTTALYRLAHEAFGLGWTVLVTTTTKIFPPGRDQCHFFHVERDLANLRADLASSSGAPAIHVAGTEINRDYKLCGLPLEWFSSLLEVRDVGLVLVEADGAARKPLKVGFEGEPVVPRETDLALILIGLDVLGQPLTTEWVHRAERAAEILNVPLGSRVRAETILSLWLHPKGLQKGIPSSARKIVVLNKADTDDRAREGHSLAKALIDQGTERVLITSMTRADPVREILFA